MPHRRRVALLIETSNSYGRELLQGIRRWESAHGAWSIRFVEQGRGAAVPRWMRGWGGDGVIARVESRTIAAALKATGVPVVDVSAALPRPVFPQVLTDSREATRLALDHFRSRGLRQFGFVGDPHFRWAGQRGGYFSAHVRATGAECSVFSDFRSKPEAELIALGRWLRNLGKPAGVLACYDIRGQQVLEACREADLRVPDEVAVLGIHNDELLCSLCDPPLSSVEPDARRAGFEAAGLLARMMTGEQILPGVRRIEPLGVVTRQSTDVVAVGDAQLAQAIRYMRDHACEGITVEDVLRAVPMSRTALERKFRQHLDCAPREQIEAMRMEAVKHLLANSNLTVAGIAEKTGFQHPEYLSVTFRRSTGRSPRTYRAQHRDSD